MKKIILILIIIFVSQIYSQRNVTENILTFGEEKISPVATIEDVKWIAGHWQGEALGGIAEEIWSPPKAGTMMGMFRLIKNETINFYEFFFIKEKDSSLVLKLRHFNPDMTGWEERDKWQQYKLVKLGEEEVCFDGLTIRKFAADELHVFVTMKKKDGTLTELSFYYQRVSHLNEW